MPPSRFLDEVALGCLFTLKFAEFQGVSRYDGDLRPGHRNTRQRAFGYKSREPCPCVHWYRGATRTQSCRRFYVAQLHT